MKTNPNISKIIMSSFMPNIVIGQSGFDKLNSFYKENFLTFKDKPSETSNTLIKKIFASSIKCVQFPVQWKGVANSPCLVAFSFIFLKIVFEDEYLMERFLDLLENSETDFEEMFQSKTSFEEFHNYQNFQKLIGEIVLKFNSLKTIFEMGNILQDHYFAVEAFSIFLRMVLTKLKYANANQMSIRLENIEEIYGLLCDYFDLNVIEKNRRSIVSKNGESSENMAKESKIFLFQTQNLFISTIDNEEFCCGNYFQNQTDFLNSKEEIRTSTLELLKNNQDNQDNFLRPLKLEGSQSSFRLSQSDIDMGMSTSVLLGMNPENQYFNSNVTTPEFGDLMDSARFKKNEDFGSIFQTLSPKTLIAVEEDFNDAANSPCSEIGKQNLEDYSIQHFRKEENEKRLLENKISKGLNFGEKMNEFKEFCKISKESSSPESFNGLSKSKTDKSTTNIENNQSSKRSLFWKNRNSSNRIKTENKESAIKVLKEELEKQSSKEKRDFSGRIFNVNETKTETKNKIGESEDLAEKYQEFEIRTTKSLKHQITAMATELNSYSDEENESPVKLIQSRPAQRMELISNIIDMEISRGNPFLKETSRIPKSRNMKNFDFKMTSFMRIKLKERKYKKSLTPLGNLDNSRYHVSENGRPQYKEKSNNENLLLKKRVTERNEIETVSRKETKAIKFPEFLRNSKGLKHSKSKSIHKNQFKEENKNKFEKGPSIRVLSHNNELYSDKNPENFCLNKRYEENSELITIKRIKSETDLTDVYQDSHSEIFIESSPKSSLPISRARPSAFLKLPSLPDEENPKSFRQSLEHETKRLKQEDRPEIKSQFIHPQAYIFQPFIVPVNHYVHQSFYRPIQQENIYYEGKVKKFQTSSNIRPEQLTVMSSTVFSTTESPSLNSMLSESYHKNKFYFKNG